MVVGSEVAQGAFSFVYRARDASTGETFALKKILCQTDEQVQAAKQEIQTHKAFRHPHIMPLTDYAVVSRDGGAFEYYLLFPFMEVRLSPCYTVLKPADVGLGATERLAARSD